MSSNRDFHPEILSRRSEVILWVLVLITLASWIFLVSQGGQFPLAGTVFMLFMLLAAGSSSLSNWMDRNTVLSLQDEGVHFQNGLRNISLNWDQIQEVQVLSTRFGKQVHVMGTSGNFNFRTLSVIENNQGEVRSKMGFSAGNFILEQILKFSGLEEIEKENQQADQKDRSRYYARP